MISHMNAKSDEQCCTSNITSFVWIRHLREYWLLIAQMVMTQTTLLILKIDPLRKDTT